MEDGVKIHVKLALAFFVLITGPNLTSKEAKSPEYLKYVYEIVADFVNEMEKKYELRCYGSGGSMPNDVEKIEVLFISYANATIDNAREMEVRAIQDLMKKINSHEKNITCFITHIFTYFICTIRLWHCNGSLR